MASDPRLPGHVVTAEDRKLETDELATPGSLKASGLVARRHESPEQLESKAGAAVSMEELSRGRLSSSGRRLSEADAKAESPSTTTAHDGRLQLSVPSSQGTGSQRPSTAPTPHVALAMARLKGDRQATLESLGFVSYKSTLGQSTNSKGLVALVGAAMERQAMMNRLQDGLEEVRRTEDETNEALTGDENTLALRRFREKHLFKTKESGTGCGTRFCLSTRRAAGEFVTSPFVRYGILLLILMDLCMLVLDLMDITHESFSIIELVVLYSFVAEVVLKLYAFRKDFFSSWWNIFDFLIVALSLVIQGLSSLRGLRLAKALQRSVRVARIIIKVYNEGAKGHKRKVNHALDYPIEAVIQVLRKVRFASLLSKVERQRIDGLIQNLIHNTLFVPNLDNVMSQLADNSQMPRWIASNFNSGPDDAGTAPTPAPTKQNSHKRLRQRGSFSFGNSQEALQSLSREDRGLVLQQLVDKLIAWDFDVFVVDHHSGGQPLAYVFQACVQWHGFDEDLGIEELTSLTFIKAIEAQYLRRNTYHNNIHAADVVQAVHTLLVRSAVGHHVTPLHRCALLVAAAGHDVAHPGVTNNFLVATGDEEAILRNDVTVLEHMHSYRVFATLQETECDLFASFNKDDYKLVRRTIIQCILATDLSKHFELVGQFKALTQQVANGDVPKEWEMSQLMICLKMGDISHPTRNWDLHSQWTRRCVQEFYAQGEKEKAAGLTVSALMDREETNVPQAQIGFVKVLVQPLFLAWKESSQKLGWARRGSVSASVTPTSPSEGSAFNNMSNLHPSTQAHETNERIYNNTVHNLACWELAAGMDLDWVPEDMYAWMRNTITVTEAMRTPEPSSRRSSVTSATGAGAGVGAQVTASATVAPLTVQVMEETFPEVADEKV